jgi:Fe-S cluster biosynthesis and repair protein YggX
MAEQRMVKCVKLGRELPGLAAPPLKSELGQRIYDNVSQEAWRMWLGTQTMLMNEYRLNPLDPRAREFLMKQMEQFFFGEGAALPPDYEPPAKPQE